MFFIFNLRLWIERLFILSGWRLNSCAVFHVFMSRVLTRKSTSCCSVILSPLVTGLFVCYDEIYNMVHFMSRGHSKIISRRFLMKFSGAAIKELRISRTTLKRWVCKKIIQPCEQPSYGGRFVYLFTDKEIARVKKLLPKARGRGIHLIGG